MQSASHLDASLLARGLQYVAEPEARSARIASEHRWAGKVRVLAASRVDATEQEASRGGRPPSPHMAQVFSQRTSVTSCVFVTAPVTNERLVNHPKEEKLANRGGVRFRRAIGDKQFIVRRNFSSSVPVKRHRGEPGHTRDTRDTRTHKGSQTTQIGSGTVQYSFVRRTLR